MNQSKDEHIHVSTTDGTYCLECGKKFLTTHDNKARDEPKTELPDLRWQIRQRLDFFTEPGQGEKYLKDLEDELVYLAQAHIDKARLEERKAAVEQVKTEYGLVRAGGDYTPDFNEGYFAALRDMKLDLKDAEARLKSDKAK